MLLSTSRPIQLPAISNLEIILAMFPKSDKENEVLFILNTYIMMVDNEAVGKTNKLQVESMKGTIIAKMTAQNSRSVPSTKILL